MRSDYPQIFQDASAVDKYQNVVYASGSYSSDVSARQLAYMRDLVTTSFSTPPVQHDFACGTGRALRMLTGQVADAHGYDVAPAMLEAARGLGTRAALHVVPADGPTPQPVASEGPTLVTVFRLLLNATPPVRRRALAFAAAALPTADSGLLVLENHGPRRSLRHLNRWRRRDNPWFAELSDAEVRTLLHEYGFELVARRGFALTGQGWYRTPVLRHVARFLDDGLADRLPSLATNVLYVARRDRSAVGP
ncbi:MAG: methyltransferase domain-containing protein [Actinocatenispora sp.]